MKIVRQKDLSCNKCGGPDHFSRKCRTKNTQKRPRRVIEKVEPVSHEMDEKPIVKEEEETASKRKKEEIKFVSTMDDKEYIFCILNTGLVLGKIIFFVLKGAKLSSEKYTYIDFNKFRCSSKK